MREPKEGELEMSGRTNEELPKNDFDFDDLKMVWRKFAFKMKENGKETFYNAMIKRDPLITDKTHFTLEVDNEVQVEYISTHLPELQSFLRNELMNFDIGINIKITKNSDDDVKFQTGKDKFAAMARKYPYLHSLKTAFNLDIEY